MAETLFEKVPVGWRTTTLGELCRLGGGDIQTGPFGSQLHASDYVPVGIPSVMPQNIGENVIIEDGIARISQEDAQRLSRYLLRSGDIVYSRRGDVGRRALVRAEQDGWLCGTGCLRVRFGDAADSRFMSYYLGHPQVREWIVRHAVGATMPNLNTDIMSSVPVVIPWERKVQQAIAAVLGALDDKIAVNERIAVTSEELAVVLASDETWLERVELGGLVCYKREQISPSSVSERLAAHYSLPSFDSARRPEIVPPDSIKSGKFLVSEACVLLSKLNPSTPRVWLVDPPLAPISLASTEFLVLVPKEGVDAAEVWAVCSQRSFTDELASRATGTSNSHQRVRPSDVLAAEVVDPRSMSDEIRSHIRSLTARARQARSESVTLSELRDTLLPKLMSGELRVREAEKIVEDAV